mgnify:CR=1 FL=1
MFAEIHQDIREGGKPHEFSLKYSKKDATVGFKNRVRKSSKNLPGPSGYRGNVSLNFVLLLENLDDHNQPFELLIDLITHYNGMRIIHNY